MEFQNPSDILAKSRSANGSAQPAQQHLGAFQPITPVRLFRKEWPERRQRRKRCARGRVPRCETKRKARRGTAHKYKHEFGGACTSHPWNTVHQHCDEPVVLQLFVALAKMMMSKHPTPGKLKCNIMLCLVEDVGVTQTVLRRKMSSWLQACLLTTGGKLHGVEWRLGGNEMPPPEFSHCQGCPHCVQKMAILAISPIWS